MAERNYQGVYPSSTAVLNDGTVVALFNANRKLTNGNGIRDLDIGVVRLTAQGASSPTVIASPTFQKGSPACPVSLSNSLAYDERRDLLYVAYNDASSGHCALLVVRSDDHGGTWSRPMDISLGGKSGTPVYFPILAVNREGILGLLSRGMPRYSPDCWYFSTFRFGENAEDTLPLGPCGIPDSLSTESSAYLMTHIRQAKLAEPVHLDLFTIRDYLSRVSLISTADGAFHPIWSSLGAGLGELRTAAVWAGSKPKPSRSQDPQAPRLTEVTDRIKILYGGAQSLDLLTNSIMVKIAIRNASSVPLEGPLYLKVDDLESDFGEIEPIDVSETDAWHGYARVPSAAGSLSPGGVTGPLDLILHIRSENRPVVNENFVARLKLRLFSEFKR
jgi:hypothetical protein